MEGYLKNFDDAASSLKEAMEYGLLLGGKRARPLLVYATGLALGQSQDRLDYAAAAVECIHAYSLIHDDMPEMDNDKLRRGHETVHVKFGQTLA
ncbi:MAG: polyprenyl synthetase family protein, partial [Succinivibrio dextrinosolvens]|nr:polyprenyl synthetase family protein [Succinivibrio dextrinosolvens]